MARMPVWLTASRAATAAGFAVVIVAAVVILATGSTVAHLGPALVGAASLGTLVALLFPPSRGSTDTRDADV